jgi:hypothetical protein
MREPESEPEFGAPSARRINWPKATSRPKRIDTRATILATRTEDLAAALNNHVAAAAPLVQTLAIRRESPMMQLQENVL